MNEDSDATGPSSSSKTDKTSGSGTNKTSAKANKGASGKSDTSASSSAAASSGSSKSTASTAKTDPASGSDTASASEADAITSSATPASTDTTATTATSDTDTATTPREGTARTAEPTATTRPPSGGSSRPSFLALLLGGFLAAALGYLAAYYGEFGLFESADDGTEEMAQIVASHEARLDEIETLLGAPDETTDRLDASDAGLSELRDSLGSLVGNLDSLDERIGGVEAGIAGIAEDDGADDGAAFDPAVLEELTQNTASLQSELQQQIDALSQQLSDLQASVDGDTSGDELAALEQRVGELGDQVTAAEDAARSEARQIAAQAAVSEIRAAIEAGEPYSDAIGAYREASGESLSDAITAPAGSGVATVTELRRDFPDASRAALDASLQVTAGDGALDRLGAFIKAQTGARAIDEREGAGPDAVLSRAEARLSDGDVPAALSELEALPPEGRDAMSDWISRAEARVDARAALGDLPTPSSSSN